MTLETSSAKTDKRLIVAVEDSDSSRRAVMYVADMLGGVPGFSVVLFSIVHVPDEDFFVSEPEMQVWIKEQFAATDALLARYRTILVHAGFPEDKVQCHSCRSGAKSLAGSILETHCGVSCCTFVVGRRPKSKTEEFLYGSTSSRLIREAKNCAIWVVE
jgi:nucleotide-binding universal stress UspA family protein